MLTESYTGQFYTHQRTTETDCWNCQTLATLKAVKQCSSADQHNITLMNAHLGQSISGHEATGWISQLYISIKLDNLYIPQQLIHHIECSSEITIISGYRLELSSR